MNVFYEEDGAFRTGSVLADNTTSLQVESTHGKRSKIKASSILIRFREPQLSGFMEAAQTVADEIDPDFLWECAAGEEFAFDALSAEYFGHAPSALENAGVLIRLHHSPMHFYKKGRGKYKAAPPEALKAALASVEKKRKLAELQAKFVEQLKRHELPDEFAPLMNSLLYDPDKNSVAFKALASACEETGLTIPHLLEKCGALPSSHDYHLNRFLFEHFPHGIPKGMEAQLPDLPELPKVDAVAFSIDDSSTTEIDDAFSVARLPCGNLQIGIHIAAPALGIPRGSGIDLYALKMLSTIYIPGQKFTMLPQDGIDGFTLAEGETCPVASLYLEVDPNNEVVSSKSGIESIAIAANLRHDAIEPHFDEGKATDCPFAPELNVLLNFANKLESLRGKTNNANQIDYNFNVENDRVAISERKRGSPLDKIVSELMIHANTEWAKQLSEKGFVAIYRSKNNGGVRQDTTPAPHQGLGVSQYAWTTSPLRRYIDLINQRQLIAMIQGTSPAYEQGNEELLIAMRDFDHTYDTYNDFQRTMERYWSLRWLLQENVASINGTVQRENWVKLDGLPLASRVPSLPEMPPGTRVALEISQVDLFELSFHARFAEKI